jgi:hypothetical protein
MLFGRLVPGVAENERSIADVLRVVDGDRGCGAVTKQMREEATAELPTPDEDLESKVCAHELGSALRDPDRVEPRMKRRGVAIAVALLASEQDRSMHVEIAFESRPERRRRSASLGAWVLVSSAANTICQRPPTLVRWRPSRMLTKFFSRTGR